MTPAQAYEALLSKAREMANTVNRSADGKPMSVPIAFSKLFESRESAIRELVQLSKSHVVATRSKTPMDTAARPVDADYERLMARARDLAKSDTSKTVAQHFERLFTKRRRLAPADESETDDGDVAVEPDGGDADDYDAGGELDVRDRQGTTGQGRNYGRSKGDYEVSGVNTMTTARQANAGLVEGSYDPKARPSSATKSEDGIPPKLRKRIVKYLWTHPEASAEDAVRWARLPKAQRKLNPRPWTR